MTHRAALIALICLSLFSLCLGLWSYQKQSLSSSSTNPSTLSVQSHSNPSVNFRGLIIPHHLLVQEKIIDYLKTNPCPEPCKLVFLTPLHQGQGITQSLVGRDDLNLQSQFGAKLATASATQLTKEHSLQDLQPLIDQYYKGIPLTQLIISNYVPQPSLENLAAYLAQLLKKDPNLRLILTVDFSHYLSTRQALINDHKTISILNSTNYYPLLELNDDFLDGRAPLFVFMQALLQADHATIQIDDHTNSGILLKAPNQPTTSHIFATVK